MVKIRRGELGYNSRGKVVEIRWKYEVEEKKREKKWNFFIYGVYESGQKLVKDKLEAEIIMQHRKRMNTYESCVVQRGRKMWWENEEGKLVENWKKKKDGEES